MGNQQFTNYPNGFPSGVTIRNLPLLNTYSGNIFWVDSGAVGAADGNPGTFSAPFATIDGAINNCTANNGDIILVNSGHTETVSAASGITADIAGVSIIGLGSGNDRPKITFGTVVGASMVVSAASVTIQNIIGIAGLDSLTKPIDVTGDDFYLQMEWQDPTSLIEAVRAVLLTGVDRAYVDLKYRGQTGGNACVNGIRLVNCTGVTIKTDFYGLASTAWVEFLTTASSNVQVDGYMYNSGTTTGAKNVIDTVGGSTWFATVVDGAAGATYSGGSAAAMAADDVSTLAANMTVPTADVTTNTLERDVIGNKTDAAVTAVGTTKSITAYAKGLVTMNTVQSADSANNAFAGDVIGNKTDAGVQAVTTTKSLMAYLKACLDILVGTTGITTFPAAAAAANSVSLAEVARYSQDSLSSLMLDYNASNYLSVTADFTSATWNTVAAHEIATVTGDVHLIIVPIVASTPTSAGSAATLILGDETTTNSIITSTDAENLATGEVWFDSTDTRTLAAASIFEKTNLVVPGGKDIGYTIGTEALTGGSIVFHMWWRPISATGNVVAGAGGAL